MLLKRSWNLIAGFFSRMLSSLEARNPESLLELERENLRKQIVRYNEGLAAHAGLCERLISQVKTLEKEEKDLTQKTTATLKAGNREAAGAFALRLQTVQRELKENSIQAAEAETTYKTLLGSRDSAIAAAKAKIDSLKQSIDQLKVKTAMAELTDMASGMVTSMGGAGDTLDRLQQVVKDANQKASGRVRVAQDSLHLSNGKTDELGQKALADQALADFAAAAGISSSASSDEKQSAPAAKTMGPLTE